MNNKLIPKTSTPPAAQKGIPEKDFVGRYGGDEFIAVIYHTNEAEIEEILFGIGNRPRRLRIAQVQIFE